MWIEQMMPSSILGGTYPRQTARLIRSQHSSRVEADLIARLEQKLNEERAKLGWEAVAINDLL